MKKFLMLAVAAVMASMSVLAQDFDLYYAKDVTDVTQFRDLKQLDRELTWRKMDTNVIDGNQEEVNQVKNMLMSPQMKGQAQQQQFWRMRDHTLLCFRINDGNGQTGSYHVEVNYGKDADGKPLIKTLTTSSYFFTNVPLQDEETTVKVWRVGDPDHYYQLRYWTYDWNNDDVYIFQLDQKRQSTGDTYKMEYVTAYTDSEGELITESTTLELKETYFQSFYVPEGRSLMDVYFLTGNQKEGDVKLKLNLDNLHPGIDIDSKFDIPQLTSTFGFSKHENRELINFNWIGTGLFEKYDTLFLKLLDQKGKVIEKATINIHRVDEDGEKVNDTSLKYLGYDKKRKQHQILTYGHPAYIEILASNCIPTLYRYEGAADADTRIVSEDLCSAKLTLKSGKVGANEIGISDQYLRYLENRNIVVVRDNEDYSIFTIKQLDMSTKLAVDTLAYMDNGGDDYPKLVNNKPVDRLAQIEVVFSSPKGNANPTCQLTATELSNNARHLATDKEVKAVSATEFTNFTRDYYFMRLSLVDVVPRNSPCRLTLDAQGTVYDKFPVLTNVHFDPVDVKKSAEEEAEESTNTGDNTEKAAKANQESGLGISFPGSFRFDAGPFKMNTAITIDIKKGVLNTLIVGTMNSNDDIKEEDDKYSEARKNARTLAGYNYKTYGQKDEKDTKGQGSANFSEDVVPFKDWVLNESGSIFDVNPGHIGMYYGGGFKLHKQAPLTKPYLNTLQEGSIFVEGGYGTFWSPKTTGGKMADAIDALSFIGLVPDIGFVFDTNLKMEGGIKMFTPDILAAPVAKNMGLFVNATFSSRLGAWATFRTPSFPFGGLKFGLRGGVKAAVQGGVASTLDVSEAGYGARVMLLGIVECFINAHALCFHYSASIYGRVGKQWLFPNNDVNPFHSDFPYWIPKESKVRTVANSYRSQKAPEANALGKALITDVAIDANPHFIDQQHVVYNDLGKADDYNDDCIKMLNTEDQTIQTISDTGTAATQHMRSKRGKAEIVVFQQMTEVVNSSEVTDENAVERSSVLQNYNQIRASVRRVDGSWQQMDVTPDDGFSDQTPVVTIQDDGKAACIYQHGVLQLVSPDAEPDKAQNYLLVGELQLRTFDGEKWSAPTRLFDIDTEHQPMQYDLFMRNDTVLVGVNMTNSTRDRSDFCYASKPLASPTVSYVDEELHPSNFFMNRVGQNAVIAMLYERPDSTRDVYVKTLAMNGHSDGRSGCDLGLEHSSPLRVKIVCDRSDDNANDFAVLWTETNNIIRDAVEGNSANEDMGLVLNASRIHLSQTPTVTYPLTVGAECDSLIMTDFDGFLDDSRIQVVYTLANLKTGGAVVMQNEKVFVNSFESDVTYTREALLGSGTLPVNVTIRNTGTSSIQSATVTINGQTLDIDGSFVPPLKEKEFTVQYPIPADFDGYMSSRVDVVYDNLFKTQNNVRRRNMSFVRQSQDFKTERVAYGDIDCNVVSHSIEDGGANIFIVELIDRSSRGLAPGTAVLVGIYPHPLSERTLTGQAQTLVTSEDFYIEGGVRRAYALVYVSGITEPVEGYIVPHIFDEKINDKGYTYYDNARACRHSPRINLFPTADPTKVVRPTLDGEPNGHRITVKYERDGVRLENLESGDEVRLFNPQGVCIHSDKTDASTLFIPLNRHGIYLLSAGDEVFKFNYQSK